jgi:alpha-1,3-rhamnosyl/mannosyltransferase
MRIGVDATTWFNERGFGRFTRDLVRALVQRDRHAYTLVLDREPSGDLPEGAGVLVERTSRTVTQAAVGEGNRSPRDMLALALAVARARFDVFFFPAVYSFYPLVSRTPCVVTFHDTIAERFPDLTFPTKRNALFWNAKCRVAKAYARRVMTVSEASASDLSAFFGIPRARIDVITEAADPIFRVLEDRSQVAAIRRRFDVPEEAPLLTYVGGLNPHKNLITLLRALPGVLAARPEVHLAIVGDTSGRGFFDNAAELMRIVRADPALDRRVRFCGYLSDADMVSLLNGSLALVLPSLSEGFGLPAVEAMACGAPVLASRRGSLPEVIGDAGLFFDPLSPAEIAAAIARLSGDADLHRALVARALERAATFTWDRGAALAELCFERCAA